VDSQGSLGRRIRATRINRGLSQAQLALPELSDSYVSLIESGKRVPTPDVVRLLARKLGCSASYLSSGINEDAQDRMRVTLEYADIALRNGEAAEARDRLAELLADPDLGSLPEYVRRARWSHALALEATGDLEEALSEFAALTAVLSPEYDTEEWIRLNIAISRCHREKGDAARSVAVAEGAFDQVTARPGPWSDETVKLGATLVDAYLERGDLVSGSQLADRLIAHADEAGSSAARMAAYWEAAIVARYQADFEKAVAYGERALALLGEAADLRNLSRLRGEYGTLMLLAHPHDAVRARDELQRASREMTETAVGGIDIARCLTELAKAELALGQPRRAADRAAEALDLLGTAPRSATAGALIVLGEARVRLGRPQEAAEVLNRAVECLRTMEPSREVAENWFNLAELLSETGDEENRAEAYRNALSCAGL
jgi:transcriptional regulator with XRE-family HTH domain